MVYKDGDEYLVRIWERTEGIKNLHFWGTGKWGLIDMMKIINRKSGGRITINTLPKKIMERARKELILDRLK